MRRINSAVRRLDDGGAELLAGAMIILLSAMLISDSSTGDLLLQALILSVVPLLRIPYPVAILPLLLACLLWTSGVAGQLLLSGPLVYLAVEYALARRRWTLAAIISAQWLVFAYGITLGATPNIDHLPSIILEILFLSAAAAVGAFRWLVLRSRHRHQVSRQRLERELRSDVARYLHDSLARSLTTISMQAELARMEAVDSPLHPQLERIADSGRNAVEDLRQLVDSLMNTTPTRTSSSLGAWKTPTIGTSVTATIRLLQDSGYRLSYDPIDSSRRFPRAVETAFALAFNEVTTNLVRHASPTANVTIRVDHDCEWLTVTVRNSRASPHSNDGQRKGVGLSSIRKRMCDIGGRADFHVTAECWQVTLSIPAAQQEMEKTC